MCTKAGWGHRSARRTSICCCLPAILPDVVAAAQKTAALLPERLHVLHVVRCVCWAGLVLPRRQRGALECRHGATIRTALEYTSASKASNLPVHQRIVQRQFALQLH